MTIEQARQQIKAHRIPIEDLLDELEWYREKDLIRREDVPLMRLYMAINTNHFDDAVGILNRIPKAEYRGEDNDD